MAEAKEEKKTSKIKKKRWYQILAPNLLKGALLGETLVTDSNLIVGRTISVNLMSLFNDIRKQNINVKFLINQVQNDRALTEITGYEVIPASLRRLIRKGKERVDISFLCETSDKKKVRIKPLFLITTKTKGSTEYSLRKQAVDFLKKTISKTTYDDLVTGLVSHKLQESLRDHLKKIYPLRICEIRYMAIEKEKKTVGEKEAEAEEKPEDKTKVKKEAKPAEEVKEEKSAKQEKVEAKKPEAEASS